MKHSHPQNASIASKINDKLKQTLASLRLEGMTLSQEALEDLHALETGQLSEKECLERAFKRAKSF